jgi:hypothetical protein
MENPGSVDQRVEGIAVRHAVQITTEVQSVFSKDEFLELLFLVQYPRDLASVRTVVDVVVHSYSKHVIKRIKLVPALKQKLAKEREDRQRVMSCWAIEQNILTLALD